MEKCENETILPNPPLPIPKTDTVVKQEINAKEARLISLENKENIIDGRSGIAPCRLKNDVRHSHPSLKHPSLSLFLFF